MSALKSYFISKPKRTGNKEKLVACPIQCHEIFSGSQKKYQNIIWN